MAAKKKEPEDSKDSKDSKRQDKPVPAHVPAAYEAVVETLEGGVELRADGGTVTFGNTVFDRELWLAAQQQFRAAQARIS